MDMIKCALENNNCSYFLNLTVPVGGKLGHPVKIHDFQLSIDSLHEWATRESDPRYQMKGAWSDDCAIKAPHEVVAKYKA